MSVATARTELARAKYHQKGQTTAGQEQCDAMAKQATRMPLQGQSPTSGQVPVVGDLDGVWHTAKVEDDAKALPQECSKAS